MDPLKISGEQYILADHRCRTHRSCLTDASHPLVSSFASPPVPSPQWLPCHYVILCPWLRSVSKPPWNAFFCDWLMSLSRMSSVAFHGLFVPHFLYPFICSRSHRCKLDFAEHILLKPAGGHWPFLASVLYLLRCVYH